MFRIHIPPRWWKVVSKRWYQENKREPGRRDAKSKGYRARSAYKLKQIQERFGILKFGDSVLDIGCYPGRWPMFWNSARWNMNMDIIFFIKRFINFQFVWLPSIYGFWIILFVIIWKFVCSKIPPDSTDQYFWWLWFYIINKFANYSSQFVLLDSSIPD